LATGRSVVTGAGTIVANIAEGPTGCGALGTNVYDFARSVILNMTEAVQAPASLADFKTEPGVCGQTNVASGSALDNSTHGLLSITAPSSTKYNNDHLIMKLGDWRTIDDSNHFSTTAQTTVANQISEGSSLKDLMQIVSIKDASGLAATAGNGRGVLVVDATPALATVLSHNGSGITVKFDQSISLADNGVGAEFTLEGGEGGVTYSVNLGTNTSDATHGTISRDTAYVDRYGATLAANTAIDITVTAAVNPDDNVPGGQANSMLTIALVDPSTSAGSSTGAIRAMDFSDYLNELSYASAAASIGSKTITDSTATTMSASAFYMDYPNLRDNNFNTWANVETFDQYDGGDTPRLLGVDGQGPRLETVAQDAATPNLTARDADGTYLHASTGITVTSIHATLASDTDVVYTSASTATGAITSGTTDTELGYVYGYANGAITAVGNNVRLVVKTSTEDMDITEAVAFVYDADDSGVNGAGLDSSSIIATDASPAGGSTYTGGGAVANAVAGEVALAADGTSLIIELPARTNTSGDQIVIQNIALNGHFYSIFIPVPAARALTTAGGSSPSTTEAGIASLSPTIWRHVSLDGGTAGEDTSAIQTGTNVQTTTAGGASNIVLDLNFRERLASTVTTGWTRGDDGDIATAATLADDNSVVFAVTGAVSSATNAATTGGADTEGVTLTLNAVDATTGAVIEGETDRRVGHNAMLTVGVSDHSGNPSTVNITFRKGHSTAVAAALGAVGEETDAILNIISGSAID